MDERTLMQLFDSEQIPELDDNQRKMHINLAVAEFEKNQKISQGKGFWARLISKDTHTRRENMSFSKKKIVYGGLATACVALLVYNIVPMVYQGGAAPTGLVTSLRKSAESQVINTYTAERSDMSISQDAAKSFSGSAPAAPTIFSSRSDSSVYNQQEFGRDKFKHVDENSIHQVTVDPVSTFSIDVDTASYSYARSSLIQGILPQKDSVQIGRASCRERVSSPV